MEGHGAKAIDGVHARAPAEQEPSEFEAAFQGGVPQGCGSGFPWSIDVRAVFNQEAGDLGLAFENGIVEQIGGANRILSRKQDGNNVSVIQAGGVLERGCAGFVREGRIGSAREQEPGGCTMTV
jgi:hypothetical protein